MLLDSFEFAEEDIRKRQLIEARNEAATIMRAAEKALADYANGLIDETERAGIRDALDNLRQALAGEDYQLIREKTNAVDAASQHLAEIIMDSTLVAALKDRKASEVAEG
jgi:molecular chaperone DnaK (HSP70)